MNKTAYDMWLAEAQKVAKAYNTDLPTVMKAVEMLMIGTKEEADVRQLLNWSGQTYEFWHYWNKFAPVAQLAEQ